MYTQIILDLGIYLYPGGSKHLSPTYFLFCLRGFTGNCYNGSSKCSLLRKQAKRSRKCYSEKLPLPFKLSFETREAEESRRSQSKSLARKILKIISVSENNLERTFRRRKLACAGTGSHSEVLIQ